MKQWEAKLTFNPYLEYSNQIKDITKYDAYVSTSKFCSSVKHMLLKFDLVGETCVGKISGDF